MPKLKNLKHEAFCQEYLLDLNSTQAYARTYKTKNLNSARINASKLLTNANIHQRIQELANERSEKTKITAEKILQDIHTIATFDIVNLFNKDGTIKSIHEIPSEYRKSISSIKFYENKATGQEICEECQGELTIIPPCIKEIKIYDKLKALEDLGRHLKLFTDRIEVTGKIDNLADELSKARKRIEENRENLQEKSENIKKDPKKVEKSRKKPKNKKKTSSNT